MYISNVSKYGDALTNKGNLSILTDLYFILLSQVQTRKYLVETRRNNGGNISNCGDVVSKKWLMVWK